jgi:hypothetical protein
VTEPSSVKPFPDARPPHLPDTLTRLSPWVLFFVAIVALQLWRLVQAWQPSVIPGDVRSAIEYILSWVPALTAPLIGVALFYRHPDARVSLRVLVFGVILLSFGELMSAFQEPIRDFLRGLAPADDPTLLAETPADLRAALCRSRAFQCTGSRGDQGRTTAHRLAGGARRRRVDRQPDRLVGASRRFDADADHPGDHRRGPQRGRHIRVGVSGGRDDQRVDRT